VREGERERGRERERERERERNVTKIKHLFLTHQKRTQDNSFPYERVRRSHSLSFVFSAHIGHRDDLVRKSEEGESFLQIR
jgi:hypothetical protein